jgi:hypothetical protein
MARTHHTARKSTGRLPVGQLAPRNVPQPQESQPDIPQEATPEEEPFEIELVVPESPTAQDSPAAEQQLEDHGTEDKTDEEQPPLSDTELEKMYRDADEVESFGAESPILAIRLRALLEHLGITTAPPYRIKEVPRSGRVEFKAIAEIFFGSRILCQHKGPAFRTLRSDAVAMPPGRPSHHESVATRAGCRTQNTTSYLIGKRIFPEWRWYTTRMWRWSRTLAC